MRWLARVRKRPPTRRRWVVSWLHHTDNSSWWSELILQADTAEDAARQVRGRVDINEHTTSRDRRLKVRVYGPIPDECQWFRVGESTTVEREPKP